MMDPGNKLPDIVSSASPISYQFKAHKTLQFLETIFLYLDGENTPKHF